MHIVLVDHLLKTKKEYKNFKKQKIHNILKKQSRQSFSMIWLMKILRVWLEDKLLIKYYVINYLILLKIPNMININANFDHWFINILIKSLLLHVHGQRPELCKINLLVVVLKVKLFETNNYLKNYTNKLLENLENESILIF